MKFAKQKQIKEEVDNLFPKKKGNLEYNLFRCKYTASRLHGDSKEKTLEKLNI